MLSSLKEKEEQLRLQVTAVNKIIDSIDNSIGDGVNPSHAVHAASQRPPIVRYAMTAKDLESSNTKPLASSHQASFVSQAKQVNQELALSSLLPLEDKLRKDALYNYLHNNQHGNIHHIQHVNELLPSQLQLMEYRENKRQLTIDKYYLLHSAAEHWRHWRLCVRNGKWARITLGRGVEYYKSTRGRMVFSRLSELLALGNRIICKLYLCKLKKKLLLQKLSIEDLCPDFESCKMFYLDLKQV